MPLSFKFNIRYYYRIFKKHSIEFLFLYFSNKIILVYTSGKVGSSSIYKSLKKHFGDRVLFTHHLLKSNTDELKAQFELKNKKAYFQKMGLFIYNHYILKNKPIKIVSIVRDPIERNISAFFQHPELYDLNLNESIEHNKEKFENNFDHLSSLTWWTSEFEPALNLTLQEINFNIEEKYTIYKSEKLELLILRFDLNNSKKSQIIKSFFKLSEFELNKINVTAQKKVGAFYKQFKTSYKPKKSTLNKVFNHPVNYIFYSKNEIENMIKNGVD